MWLWSLRLAHTCVLVQDSLCQLLKLLPGSNMAVEVAHLQAQLAQAPLLDRDMERAAACRMCSPNGCSSCAH